MHKTSTDTLQPNTVVLEPEGFTVDQDTDDLEPKNLGLACDLWSSMK